MGVLTLLKRALRQRANKPALTANGFAVGHGIEKLDIVPGASRRLATLQARVAAASMTDVQREAHIQVFGTPAEKELMAAIRKQQSAD